MQARIGAFVALAALVVACADSKSPIEPLEPDAPSGATIMLSGGTSSDIQSAVNSVSNAGGGTVVLNGTYHMTGPVGLRSNVTIDGVSRSNNRLYCDPTATVHFFVRFTATTNLSLVALKNLNADGCGGRFLHIHQNSNAQDPVLISNLRIEGNDISGFQDNAIIIASDSSAQYRQRFTSVVIKNNRMTKIGMDAIRLGGRSEIDCCVNGPVDITDNFIDFIGTPGSTRIGFGILVAHTADIDILRNRVDRTCEDGIRITHSTQARIKSNRLNGVRHLTSCDASGIKSHGSTNVVIQHDTVLNHTGSPHIEVLGGSGIDILNNYVWAGDTQSYDTRGIVVWPGLTESVEDVLISGNRIQYAEEAILIMPRVWTNGSTGLNIHFVDVVNNHVRSTCAAIMARRFGSSSGYVRHLNIDNNDLGRNPAINANCGFADPNLPPPPHSVYLDGAGYVSITNNRWWQARSQKFAWNVTPVSGNILVNQ